MTRFAILMIFLLAVDLQSALAQQTDSKPARTAGGSGASGAGSTVFEEVTRFGDGSSEAPATLQIPMTAQPEPGDWTAYGRSNAATRYSPLSQINRENIERLERVWEFRTGDMPPESVDDKWAPETTPLKIGNALYLCTPMNIMIRLDAATGRERWRYDPGVTIDSIPYSASCRGVSYYEAPGMAADEPCKQRIIQGTLDARLIAVDAETGRLCAGFGVQGQVNLLEGMGDTVPGFVAVTSPPTIVRGVAVVGHQVLDGQKEDSPSGVIRGYDARTGQLAWAWDMGRPGETGMPPEGETYTRGTPNAWTTFSGDEELGMVYVPMGNSAVDYFGGNRKDVEEPYSTALVALDATSGEVQWSFQVVHHDVWDYDLGSQGTLVDFPMDDGSRVPAVVLPTKMGDIYVLDRRTGEPLTPVEQRPVPASSLPGERLSETQPFSVGMPRAGDFTLEEKDAWGMTPLDQLWCRIQFRRSNYQGMYTPPSVDRPWIQYPGYNGGNDWGGASVDTERDILVLNYSNTPMRDQLIPREKADEQGMVAVDKPGGKTSSGGPVPQEGAPYAVSILPWRLFTGLMCNQPPYGGIMAIDLKTRKVIWDRPLGTARGNGPFGIKSYLPFTIGTPNNGGPIVTAGGLVFIAAATDDQIRAIDLDTGDVLWEDVLPAGGQATPMTYEVGGKQFVVIVAGGHHFMETPIGDHVIAYALPPEETDSRPRQ